MKPGGDVARSKYFKSLRVRMLKHSLGHQILQGRIRGSSGVIVVVGGEREHTWGWGVG